MCVFKSDDSGEDYTELENDEEISEVDVEEFEDRKSTFLKLSWEMDTWDDQQKIKAFLSKYISKGKKRVQSLSHKNVSLSLSLLYEEIRVFELKYLGMGGACSRE